MFYGCINMTITASDSPTINVAALSDMFRQCEAITEIKNLFTWDVSLVTDFRQMFLTCPSLNPDISSWDMRSAVKLTSMVKNTSFDRDLSNWDIKDITHMNQFAATTTMSTANYDALLIAWNLGTPQSSVTAHFGSAKYTGGAPADSRANLVATHGWTITDGGTA